MKTNKYLLPGYFRTIGWAISIPAAVYLLAYWFSGAPWEAPATTGFRFGGEFIPMEFLAVSRLLPAAVMVFLTAGLLCIAFARQKTEDEYVMKLRSDSLIWAVLVNSVLLLLAMATIPFIPEFPFFFIALINIYTVLLLFAVKFRMALHRLKKQIASRSNIRSLLNIDMEK